LPVNLIVAPRLEWKKPFRPHREKVGFTPFTMRRTTEQFQAGRCEHAAFNDNEFRISPSISSFEAPGERTGALRVRDARTKLIIPTAFGANIRRNCSKMNFVAINLALSCL